MPQEATRVPPVAPSEGSDLAQRGAAFIGGDDAEVEELEEDGEGQPGDRRSEALHPGLEQEVMDDRGLFGDAADMTVDWEQPSAIPNIPPRKGFVQRWIRVASFGADDARNQSMKTREGWRSRDPKTVPGMYAPPLMRRAGHGMVIAVEGLVLCEMPVRRAKQRKAFYDQRRAAQARAVDEDINRISAGARPGIGRIEKTAHTQVTTSAARARPLRPQPDGDASDHEVT